MVCRGGAFQASRTVMQTGSPFSENLPIELAHGKNASFMVSFNVVLDWISRFATGFVRNKADLGTLRAVIHTSVGTSIDVRPEADFLEELGRALDAPVAAH